MYFLYKDVVLLSPLENIKIAISEPRMNPIIKATI